MEAARKRPEIARVDTTFIPDVPQVFAKVDRDKVLKQGVNLSRTCTRHCRPLWAE